MGSDETVSVNRADLEAVLFCCDSMALFPRTTESRDRLRAALTPPSSPWSPTDQEIDATREAFGYGPNWAREHLIRAHDQGFDAVPRRIERTGP